MMSSRHRSRPPVGRWPSAAGVARRGPLASASAAHTSTMHAPARGVGHPHRPRSSPAGVNSRSRSAAYRATTVRGSEGQQGYSEVEFGWCSQGMAFSGQATTSRVAAAMLGVSMRFNKYTATFRKDASTCGAFPLRTRHRSSPKVTSRT